VELSSFKVRQGNSTTTCSTVVDGGLSLPRSNYFLESEKKKISYLPFFNLEKYCECSRSNLKKSSYNPEQELRSRNNIKPFFGSKPKDC
jgi:hypothetical protein